MKVLVTGGTGIIGRYLLKQIKDKTEAVATYFRNINSERIENTKYCYLDITAKEKVLDFFKQTKPDIIIHTASIGSVDFSENHKEETRLVNVGGTENAIEGARACNARFIFISSNAIFDGEKPPYKETDLPNPINYYGKLKWESEKIVASSGLDYAIARPILIYGWNDSNERANPATWLLSKLKNGERVKIVNDRYCNPLLVNNCADAIRSIIEHNKKGIYHIGGRDRISRFGFAIKIAKIFDLNYELIESVPNAYFKGIAPRPKDTTYSTEKMQNELGVRPIGIDEGLKVMKEEKERLLLWQK